MEELEHLRSVYPHLAGLLEDVGPMTPLEAGDILVAEAVTKIVVGQMLSRRAADTIYGRLHIMREANRKKAVWLLSDEELRKAGLSARKARTIQEFAQLYENCPKSIEAWRELSYEQLTKEMSKLWGISQWSTDMLAIFYFANPDVFPETDGTIMRARASLDELFEEYDTIQPAVAQPYRSYLALYLWAFVDRGLLPNRNGPDAASA